MTREILNSLPQNILKTIEIWKGRYNDDRFDKPICKGEIRGYLMGLRDAGIITDNQYRCIFVYMTL